MEQPRAKKTMYSIPEDIVFEILLRLPAKSIGRFTCVSKLWARIIHSEVFVRSFSLKKQKPHFLFAFNEFETVQKSPVPEKLLWEIFFRLPEKSKLRFFCLCKLWAKAFTRSRMIRPPFLFESNDSIEGYQEKWHFFSKSTPEFLSNTVCQLKKLRYQEPSYVHGLISFVYGEEQVVSNPTTGKSITLPTVINPIIRSFLGYDPIDAKYKVLCLTKVDQLCNHQVLTLGPRPENWRTISCSTPHHPSGTNYVCIDGVLYYIASSGTEQLLVGFDLRSETLEITSILPQGIASNDLFKTTLINYHGKLALAARLDDRSNFNLWVLQDAKKQDWVKQVVYLPLNYKLLGVSEMGEFVYAPTRFDELSVYFVNHKSNKVTSVKVRGNNKHNIRDFFKVFIFINHVESLMFM